VDLYIHSPIGLHGLVLDSFTFTDKLTEQLTTLADAFNLETCRLRLSTKRHVHFFGDYSE
jgi:hypothetical protein